MNNTTSTPNQPPAYRNAPHVEAITGPTFTQLKDSCPFISGATPFNRTATAWSNRDKNGNKNNRPKNYRHKDGKNLSGGSSRSSEE